MDRQEVPATPSLIGRFASRTVLPLLYARQGTLEDRIRRDRADGPAPRPRRLATEAHDETGPGGRRYRLITKGEPRGTILYLHGGYYLFDFQAAHWRIIEGLSRRTGLDVVAPLYPLAPEHTVTDGLAAAMAEYRTLAGQGPLVVAGDSAGGGLATAVAQQAAAEGLSRPDALLLIAPWLDATMTNPKLHIMAAKDHMLSIDRARDAAQMWSGGINTADPRLSPINGDLKALPPTQLLIGDRDLLLPDAEKLKTRRPETDLKVYPEMFHVFPAAPIPEARHALDVAALHIQSATSRG